MTRVLLGILVAGVAFAQTGVLSVAPATKLHAKRGATVSARIHAQLKPGYHVNSNTPNDDYLIPLKLTWSADPLSVAQVVYPKPQTEKASFSEKPLSVFSGDFEIETKFKVPANATSGPAIATGKLRYQACNDRMCLPPKTVEIPLTVMVE